MSQICRRVGNRVIWDLRDAHSSCVERCSSYPWPGKRKCFSATNPGVAPHASVTPEKGSSCQIRERCASCTVCGKTPHFSVETSSEKKHNIHNTKELTPTVFMSAGLTQTFWWFCMEKSQWKVLCWDVDVFEQSFQKKCKLRFNIVSFAVNQTTKTLHAQSHPDTFDSNFMTCSDNFNWSWILVFRRHDEQVTHSRDKQTACIHTWCGASLKNLGGSCAQELHCDTFFIKKWKKPAHTWQRSTHTRIFFCFTFLQKEGTKWVHLVDMESFTGETETSCRESWGRGCEDENNCDVPLRSYSLTWHSVVCVRHCIHVSLMLLMPLSRLLASASRQECHSRHAFAPPVPPPLAIPAAPLSLVPLPSFQAPEIRLWNLLMYNPQPTGKISSTCPCDRAIKIPRKQKSFVILSSGETVCVQILKSPCN